MKPVKWIKKEKNVFWPSKKLKQKAWINSKTIYEKAMNDPVKFWAKLAKEGVSWYENWKQDYVENLPYFKWFVGGKLNASYNALDRHMKSPTKDKPAIIWEPEPLEEKNRVITYTDLYKEVNRFANVLKNLGIRKGDAVGIYLPLIPEVQIAMLACARIGAMHTVVFSAFSPDALRYRLQETESKILITADGYYRRGEITNLKQNADEGIKDSKVEKVIVVKRAGNEIDWVEGRDFWWSELIESSKDYCEPEIMESEDTLFILYTSGTTGRPKGVIHSTGGYLVQAYWTTRWDFDMHDDDVMWCTADIGWVTGHTYACYGPLLNGSTMVIFEGAIDYPQPDRWCSIIEKYGVTVFYTAPTAIRMFMKYDGKFLKKHDLSCLRILGTVGEPINKEAWDWYFTEVGGGRCPVIDTWWQTETGGTLINALPGIGPFIPTVAGKGFPGTKYEILDESGNVLASDKEGNLVMLSPFAPGMLRGVYKNPEKYFETYWKKYGNKYFTSDGAHMDREGNYRLTGRVDDVMKVAGHRISTAELEDAISRHQLVAECAVVPVPHDIKGETPVAFVILKGTPPSEKLEKELIKQVEKYIGPIARPSKIIFVEDLPRTRSGKIIRRLLKSILKNEELGDVATLANPESVDKIRSAIKK